MITLKTISRAVLALSAAVAVQGAMAANGDTTVSVNGAPLASLGTVTISKLGAATYTAGASNTGTLQLSADAIDSVLADFAAADGFKISVSSLFLGTNSVSFSNFTHNLETGLLSGSLLGAGGILGNLNYTGDLIDATTISGVGTGTLTFSNFQLSQGLSDYLAANGVTPSQVPVGDMIRSVAVAVPEPSTYALMGLGLVGIALTARKRQAV